MYEVALVERGDARMSASAIGRDAGTPPALAHFL
jgi:hypothetical protein